MNTCKLFSKTVAVWLSIVLILAGIPFTSFAENAEFDCTHQHSAQCGYVENAPCGHVHDENCGADGMDCAHVHDEGCGYIPAEPCGHEHDQSCGGSAIIYTVLGFSELSEEVKTQSVEPGTVLEDLLLPQTIMASVTDGETETVSEIEGVTWRPDSEYEGLTGKYEFTAALPEGFDLSVGAALPVITVEVLQTGDTPDILPDLSGYYMPKPPAKKASAMASPSRSGGNAPLKIFDSSKFKATPINGLDDEVPLDISALSAPQRFAPAVLPVGNIGDKVTMNNLDNRGGTLSFTLSGKGTYCDVYVANNDPATTMASEFMPSGTTPHANVNAIITEFDDEIYGLVTGLVGAPIYPAAFSQKIKIVLYDMYGDGDPDFDGGYVAGFFNGGDFQGSAGYNNDAIIYVDIGDGQGYFMFDYNEETRMSFYGTVAHEFQHLINFSNLLDHLRATPQRLIYPEDASDPDWGGSGPTIVTTWYNEGLSGLVGALYLQNNGYTMDTWHLLRFLSKDDLPASGYIPTRAQWSAGGGKFAHYGAVSAMMQEYYAVTNNAQFLAKNPKTGYTYSLENVSEGYYGAGAINKFNEFFTIANLDIQVDSPAGPPVRYYTNVSKNFSVDGLQNTWDIKSGYFQDGLDTQLTVNAPTSFNSVGRTYYTDTYIASAVGAGNSAVKITLPNTIDGEYYVITPYNATNIYLRYEYPEANDWNLVPKMAARLNPGENIVTVGTNNMFAILAIAHDTPVNESFKYEITTPPTSSLTMTPVKTTLTVSGETNGQTVATASATGIGGTATYSISSGTLPAGLEIDELTGTITVTNAGALVVTSATTVTVKVTGSLSGTATATITMTVNTTVIPTYTVSVNPAGKTFTAAVYGYSNTGMAQQFTITNTGNQPITNLTATLGTGTNFEVSAALSGTSLNVSAPGNTATISIRPKGSLAANAAPYTDTLVIRWDNDDGTGLVADLSFTVSKANQYIPAMPTAASKNATSITLNDMSGGVSVTQYRLSTGTWQNSPEFTGLTPNTGYIFYARFSGNENYNDSLESPSSNAIYTDKAALTGTLSITAPNTPPQYLDTLTANTSGLAANPGGATAMGALSYQWNRDGSAISGATGSAYEVQAADIGKKISVTVTAANCQSPVTSAETNTVAKRTPVIGDLTYTAPIPAVDYNGSSHTISVTTSKTGFGQITVKYGGSTTAPTNAGNYTVTVSIAEDANYAASAADITLGTFTINKIVPTALLLEYTPALPTTVNYDTNPHSVAVTARSGVVGLGAITVKYNDSTTAPTAAGVYAVTADIAAGTNYSAAVITLGNLTINGVDIPAGNITVTPYSGTYDNAAHSITVSDSGGGTVTYCETQNGTYTAVNPTYTNAGTYTVYFKVTRADASYNTYSGSSTVLIAKADPTVTFPTGATLTYGQTLAQALLSGQVITTPGTFAFAAPSTQPTVAQSGNSFSMTFTPDDIANYNTRTQNVSVTVNRAATSGVNQIYEVIKENEQTYDFDLTKLLPNVSPLSLGTVTYEIDSVSNGDGVLASEPSGVVTSPLALDVADVDQGKTAVITVTVHSENYVDFDATITVNTVDKIAVTITATMNGGVYNGSPYAYTSAAVKRDDNQNDVTSLLTLEALYESTDGAGYSDAAAPVNAGAYKLTLSVPASNTTYSGSEVFNFTITKKQVTVKADDKTVKAGGALPTATVSYTGFVGTDSAGNALATQAIAQHTAADTQTAGTFPINIATDAVLNVTNGANYTLVHQNGTLTVTDLIIFTITATAGSNGSISPSGAVSVTEGGSQTFTITANNGYHISGVTVDGVSQGTVGTYTFTGVTGNHTISASFASNRTSGSGGSGGGGGGGGSSRDSNSSQLTSTSTSTTQQWLEQNPAGTLANNTASKNQSSAQTKAAGAYGVRADSWANLAGLHYEHDTMDGNSVQVRIYIVEPAKITKDTYVSAYVKGKDVDQTRGHFEKWFSNKMQVIHFDQQTDWGQPVNIAAKVDLSGMDTESLYFYAYDKKTNTYRSIPAPAYRIDKNGYLHFTTPYAGDIIISEGPLEKK